MRIASALIVLTGLVFMPPQARAGILIQPYDAGLGSFPVDQKFTPQNTPEPGPALLLQGGLLHQDTRGHRQRNFGAIGFRDIFDDRFSAPTESVTDLAEFSNTILPEPARILTLGLTAVVSLRRRRSLLVRWPNAG